MTNLRWNPEWLGQASYERIVDACPGIYAPNHLAVYIYDDAGVSLRFIQVYQTGDFRELVLHDLALVKLGWSAARDLHDRLGQELEKRAAEGKSVPITKSIPHPQFGAADSPTPLAYFDMNDPESERAAYRHLHAKYGTPAPKAKKARTRAKAKRSRPKKV